jgi:hypothetical protein
MKKGIYSLTPESSMDKNDSSAVKKDETTEKNHPSTGESQKSDDL